MPEAVFTDVVITAQRQRGTMATGPAHDSHAVDENDIVPQPPSVAAVRRKLMHERSLSCHCGQAFSSHVLANVGRAPEERRILSSLKEDLNANSHDTRRRRLTHVRPTGHDGPQPLGATAVDVLRNIFFVHGKRAAPYMITGSSRQEAPKAKRECKARANHLPDSVIEALKFSRLHVLGAWIALNGNECTEWKDAKGCTALHYAVLLPHAEAVGMLMERGAQPNVRLPNGSTPLLLATIRRNAVTAQCLLSHGADPNLPDAEGHTPLMVASRAGDADIVRVLLAHDADLSRKDRQKHTALWYACKYEQKGAAMLIRNARKAGSETRK